MAKNDFDIYSILFHDLFYSFLQTSTTLFLFVSILNLSKEKAEDLYPIDLHSKYYGDGSCDLGNLKPGESSFCDAYTAKDYNESKAGKSFSASNLAKRAKNNGFITIDSWGVFTLWLSYLFFSCEHFTQIILNGAQQISQSLYNVHFAIQFFIIITIVSIINNLNINYINPLLTKLLNIFKLFKVSSKNQSNIFIDISIQLFINCLSIFLLLFLFFMIPLTAFYVFALCKILTENLTIQMNILSVFALFLTIKSLLLFVQFMQGQFGASAISSMTTGINNNAGKVNAVLNAGIQNGQAFQSFISSYILYFIIPILVALFKMFKLIVTLISNMNPLGLDTKYKLMFITLLLMSFYYPIKNDLDYEYDFPYSIIYAVLSGLSLAYLIYTNKSQLR